MATNKKTIFGVSAVLFTLAIAAVAFAHGGYGGSMMGPGQHMRGYGYGDGGGLSADERAKVDAAREAFYEETRNLRRDIDDARIAVRDEMRKDAPDEAKLIKLQKSLSGLQAKFDEKMVGHRLEMRKLMPEEYRGRGGRGFGGRGYARGCGRGAGGGGGFAGGCSGGPGNCWR